MLALAPTIPAQYPFIKLKALTDLAVRKQTAILGERQVISVANINPEDYVDSKQAQELVWQANEELAAIVAANPELFYAGVGMVAMNNIAGAIEIMEQQIAPNPNLIGIQVFTRALGKSIAAPEYRRLFAKAADLGLLVLLHPVFDERKPDNNLVFSWEYELSQAMLALVQAKIFKDYPNLKVIVHHAGAMIPFFSERITHILPAEQAADFKRFYVDTALLGNTKALELALDYFGPKHLLYGTDAPFGQLPAGASREITLAINEMSVAPSVKRAIFKENLVTLLGRDK